nr:ribonuclease H-like domain-containing protein [Tanacetum cinerariifolium]
MSTQQDIYAAGSKNRPPMLNKENYVPWSSRLLRYAKSRPNGKLIHNSILNGLYVRRMIPEPGDANHEVNVKEYQKKDKIGSKPDKNGKRGEAEKSQKQLQSIEKEKLKKIQKEEPKMQSHSKLLKKEEKKD